MMILVLDVSGDLMQDYQTIRLSDYYIPSEAEKMVSLSKQSQTLLV